jgi:hypothetical protein
MGKTTESLMEKVVWPLALLAFTPAITLIGSKLQSDDWLAWLRVIPSWIIWAFFAALLTWYLGGIFIRRIKHLKNSNLPSLPMFISIPAWGYTTVGKLPYQGVIWRIRVPAQPPWQRFRWEEAKAERVDVETPPHCPQCDTELEETEMFLGNFRWTCVRCNFAKKNNMSFYHEAVRAEKLAQSHWEKETRNQTTKLNSK